MSEIGVCVEGDGGPLIVLQASAAPQWQGANDWDNSIMNGGTVETDYDVICNDALRAGGCVITHRNRDMLVLWECEFGARLLNPCLLSFPSDSILITNCMVDDHGEPNILEFRKLLDKKPHSSQQFHVQDNFLRLQVGTDGSVPSDEYGFYDISVEPGKKQIDYYVGGGAGGIRRIRGNHEFNGTRMIAFNKQKLPHPLRLRLHQRNHLHRLPRRLHNKPQPHPHRNQNRRDQPDAQ